VRSDTSFADLVGQVRHMSHEAIAHQDISYGDLLKLSRGRGRRGAGELCRTVVVVDDAQPIQIDLPGAACERRYVYSGMAKFDLCFTFVAREQGYLCFLEYEAGLFSRADAVRVQEAFTKALELVTSDAELSASLVTEALGGG
jgi:hypothetical protein